MSYRKARKSLDPGLLEEARKSIIEALARLDTGETRPEQGRHPDETQTVPVDRKQNLKVIMKYIEMNPENRQVRDQLQAVLRQDI